MSITIEREGYKVTGRVYGVSGSPYGLRPSTEVDGLRGWIHDPTGFKEAHGLEPSSENLAAVMAMEEGDLIDDMIDNAREEV